VKRAFLVRNAPSAVAVQSDGHSASAARVIAEIIVVTFKLRALRAFQPLLFPPKAHFWLILSRPSGFL
jgi:hypothetical protein